MEDWAELLYSKEGVNVRPVTITRPASQFDLLEGAKPAQEINMSTINPTILVPLGVEPVTTRKLTGRIYRLKTEWRRRGNIVEIRLKDYRQIRGIPPRGGPSDSIPCLHISGPYCGQSLAKNVLTR